MKQPSYKEVKNHIHNTLGLTKEDIQYMIQQTVNKELSILLRSEELHHRIQGHIETKVNDVLGRGYSKREQLVEKVEDTVRREIASRLTGLLEISIQVKVKEEE
ncbi:hypothetical protein Bcp1_195 [Bacillus phage Bcp1]|uniref:Uncharacterized protein n=1 Tax=Bacillus phage Bcp1 TaxID=584892 RepID=X2JLF1_9CAUD|nr:hypothetical protein Bcp1_195 [Bacillus phage Bcp1]AHN66670.1 hypothetical protein Bcp1_195 [Bacillus phage Bcp1]